MAVPYVKFMKHAAKVTKGVPASRPILKGVLHDTDGSLIVTDSHRLYRTNNAYSTSEKIVQDAKTGEPIEGNYPETKRLIPEDDGQFTVKVNVKRSLDVLKAVKLLLKANDGDKFNTVRLVNEDDRLCILLGGDYDPAFMTYELGTIDIGKVEPIKMAVDGQYLLEAFDFYNDIDSQEITFSYYGDLRPFTLIDGDTTVLILPLREGKR